MQSGKYICWIYYLLRIDKRGQNNYAKLVITIVYLCISFKYICDFLLNFNELVIANKFLYQIII